MMKTYTHLSIKLVAITLLFASLHACKNKAPQVIPSDEVEVIIPCSGTEYFSSGDIFRSNSIGESKDQVVAKKKALSNARADLASQVQTTVKAVTDSYVNSREYDNREEIEERFESLNREVINQELNGTKVICEKQTKTSAGTFKSYIAVELDPNAVIAAYNS
ncbi:MAG: hypothetical protein AAGA66_19490, partial [Bacteroidota bacterium]